MRARTLSFNLTIVLLVLPATLVFALVVATPAWFGLGAMSAHLLYEQVPLVQTSVWQARDAAVVWPSDLYQQVPTLVLGLAALVLFPIISVLAALARAISQHASDSEIPDRVTERTEHHDSGTQGVARPISDRAACDAGRPVWPSKAMVELSDPTGHCRPMRFTLSRPVVQIGRSDDVDIVIPDPTVHRHHATIHCTEDAEYLVTDMGAGTGNGVVVNGHPVLQHQIFNGDEIRLGRARLMFLTAQT